MERMREAPDNDYSNSFDGNVVAIIPGPWDATLNTLCIVRKGEGGGTSDSMSFFSHLLAFPLEPRTNLGGEMGMLVLAYDRPIMMASLTWADLHHL